jgi:HK97 gp10 family phage protein
MSNTSGIKVQGLRSSIKALQAIGVDAKDIKSAGNDAGEIVAREARNLAPVKTGSLRSTIRTSKALNKVTVSAGNNGRVPYANPIHWGWFKRNIKPQPFFIKALGITRNEVYQNYYRSINKLIETNSTKGTDE